MGARIRDVAQGPDGAVYALTDEDNGKILSSYAGRKARLKARAAQRKAQLESCQFRE
jgi:hypothetical protein